MDHTDSGARELADAAAVRAARRELDLAIADLASSPMDPDHAARMKQVLDSPKLRKARDAYRRIVQSVAHDRHLRVVETDAEAGEPSADEEEDAADDEDRWDPVVVVGGAA